MKIFFCGLNPCRVSHNSKLNYTGVLVPKGVDSSYCEYEGIPTSYNVHGHYQIYDDTENNVYYPFKDESEKEIRQVLKEKNYSSSYDSYGYGGGLTVSTERGKTLPYTRKEWDRLAENIKENIMKVL